MVFAGVCKVLIEPYSARGFMLLISLMRFIVLWKGLHKVKRGFGKVLCGDL